MSWRDQLRDGSFRGVPFKIQASRALVGRRGQVHEYPLRDKPYAEDLGRRARAFNVECFVLGADYMAQRDALIAALEERRRHAGAPVSRHAQRGGVRPGGDRGKHPRRRHGALPHPVPRERKEA